MKYCPQCNLEFEEETVFCPADGSRLQVRVPRAGAKLSGSMPVARGGVGPAMLSSQPVSPLGATALQVPATSSAPAISRPLTGRVKAVPPPTASQADETAANPVFATIKTPSLNGVRRPLTGPAQAMSLPAQRTPHATGEVEAQPDRADDPFTDSPTVAMKTVNKSGPVTAADASAPDADEENEEDLVGRVIAGRYKIQKRLGEGGMGVVYQGVDERLEKQVALKVLRDDFARRTDVVARFTQEAKSAARIKHENVLDVTDYGQTEDGSFYIAMELLVGTDLADVLQSDGTVPPERGVDIAIQVCRALGAAHQKGVIHRDLKPENVFLVRSDDSREVVKIVDFGIAQMKDISGSTEGSRKLTRTGMIFGTPEYMSPEQAAGKPIDHRVDIYATGVILYEMFAGRVPFMGDTFMGVLTQHMFEQPPPIRQFNPEANLSPDLEVVIAKALAKDPAQRYASMQDLADDLTRVRNGLRPVATPPVNVVPNGPPGSFQGNTSMNGMRLSSSQNTPMGPGFPGATPSAPPLVDADPSPPTNNRARVAVAVGVVLLLIFAAVVGFLALSNNNPPPNPPHTTNTQPPPNRLTAPVPNPTNNPPTPNPPNNTQSGTTATNPVVPAVVDAGVRLVNLQINATDRNARITIEPVTPRADLAPVPPCEAAPCVRRVPAGVPLRIVGSAARGNRSGSLTVTPNNNVEIVEVRLARGAGGRDSPRQRGDAGRPCGHLDPTTHLLIPCF
jgi:serine/threonine-protein kinase